MNNQEEISSTTEPQQNQNDQPHAHEQNQTQENKKNLEETKDQQKEEIKVVDENESKQGDENQDNQQGDKKEPTIKSAEKTLEFKKLATEYFNDFNFDEAIEQYELALDQCPLEDLKMLTILNNNIAVCCLKLDKDDEVIHYSTLALKYDPNFKKALLNRAFYFEKQDKLEDALEDYKKLEENEPNDKQIRSKRALLQITVEQIQEKRKTEVLSGLKDLGNTILGKFGMSLDSFKLNQNDNGSYNIQYKQ